MKLRKGFTLVELLIVIVIIGILAGTMLLSMGSSTDGAEAAKIVSNLRAMTSASLLYYADRMHTGGVTIPTPQNLESYMNAQIDEQGYNIVAGGTNNSQWWVVYTAPTTPVAHPITAGVSARLVRDAASTGIWGAAGGTKAYAQGDQVVAMRAR